jgi:hypothetical protein
VWPTARLTYLREVHAAVRGGQPERRLVRVRVGVRVGVRVRVRVGVRVRVRVRVRVV